MNFTSRLYTKINEKKKSAMKENWKQKVDQSSSKYNGQNQSVCTRRKNESDIELSMTWNSFHFISICVSKWKCELISFSKHSVEKENLFNYSLCSIVKHKMIHL